VNDQALVILGKEAILLNGCESDYKDRGKVITIYGYSDEVACENE
jgi:hypothetical protein